MNYDSYFTEGCMLTEKTQLFLETVKASKWSFEVKSGGLYFYWREAAYDGAMRRIELSNCRILCKVTEGNEQVAKTNAVVILALSRDMRAIRILKAWGLV